jgi:hypothetical protein
VKDYNDLPFREASDQAEALTKKGYTIWQRWTCDHCGSRQTMEKENRFFIGGICEECNRVTNITKCGFSAMVTLGGNE